jgi:hypothetical protein
MRLAFARGARALLVTIFLASTAAPASADWLLTPYAGVVFGGAANTLDIADLDDEFQQRFNVGGSITFMGGGVFGFEVDYSLSPNFFQITQNGETIDIPLLDIDSSLSTLMANAVVGVPIGGTSGAGVRPYVAGGISATEFFDDLSTNELGINFGGGVHVFFSDNVGFRGDLRYFRGLSTDDDTIVEDILDESFGLEDFEYWRGTLGVTFRFGG